LIVSSTLSLHDALPIYSPLEFTAEQVAGKTLVMSTTNGTPALLAASGARRVLVAGYLNLSAVARELAEEGEAVSIVCAGRERRRSEEHTSELQSREKLV